MSKKTTFREQDDIPKDGDGSVAEEAATLIEDSKSAPRARKSTRKSMAKSTTSQAAKGTIMDAIVDTVESEGAYGGSPGVHSETCYIRGISDTESGEDEKGNDGGDQETRKGTERGEGTKHAMQTQMAQRSPGGESESIDARAIRRSNTSRAARRS